VRAFEPVESVELINGVYITPLDQQIVNFLFQNVVLSYDAIQDLLEKLDKAGAIINLLIGIPEKGDDLDNRWRQPGKEVLIREVVGHLGDKFLNDPPAGALREPWSRDAYFWLKTWLLMRRGLSFW
jgi:hypothetical protein